MNLREKYCLPGHKFREKSITQSNVFSVAENHGDVFLLAIQLAIKYPVILPSQLSDLFPGWWQVNWGSASSSRSRIRSSQQVIIVAQTFLKLNSPFQNFVTSDILPCVKMNSLGFWEARELRVICLVYVHLLEGAHRLSLPSSCVASYFPHLKLGVRGCCRGTWEMKNCPTKSINLIFFCIVKSLTIEFFTI